MGDTASESSHTSYIGSVINLARTLEAYGIDAAEPLADMGIDIDSTPAFDVRVPTGALHTALINHAGADIDPLFGLKFAELFFPASYHAFGVMLTSSTTLRAFCTRLRRYFSYINTGDKVYFDDAGTLSYQQFELPPLVGEPFDRLLHESAWAATMLKLLRLVAHPTYAPKRIRMAFPAPYGYEEQYEAYFRCPIEYDASMTAICFDPDDLDTALPGGNAELARHSERLVYDYLESFVEFGILNRARMALFDLLPRGRFDLDTLSAALEMSPEQLSSELKGADTSYQQLLGDVRRELAEEYIERADLSVNEIAYMLGFSDCSNFARSFRRWMGMSPTDYRQQHRG